MMSLPSRQHLNNHCSKNLKCHKYLEARLPHSNTNTHMSRLHDSLLSTYTSPTVGHVTGCSLNSLNSPRAQLNLFCSSVWPEFPDFLYKTNTVLPVKYFIIHLNRIQSPWRWWQYVPPKYWTDLTTWYEHPQNGSHLKFNENLKTYICLYLGSLGFCTSQLSHAQRLTIAVSFRATVFFSE
jgi:hypothetical protein